MDIVILAGIILDTITADETMAWAANLNEDEYIDILDVISLVSLVFAVEQGFTMDGTAANITIFIGPSIGEYSGKYEKRIYQLEVHKNSAPNSVLFNNEAFMEHDSWADFNAAESGWYFDNNVVYVRTPLITTSAAYDVELVY